MTANKSTPPVATVYDAMGDRLPDPLTNERVAPTQPEALREPDFEKWWGQHGYEGKAAKHIGRAAWFAALEAQGATPQAAIGAEPPEPAPVAQYQIRWMAPLLTEWTNCTDENSYEAAMASGRYEGRRLYLAPDLLGISDEDDALRAKLAGILTGVANALRGTPPPLTLWSWHDLPERVAAVMAMLEVLQRACASLAAPAPIGVPAGSSPAPSKIELAGRRAMAERNARMAAHRAAVSAHQTERAGEAVQRPAGDAWEKLKFIRRVLEAGNDATAQDRAEAYWICKELQQAAWNAALADTQCSEPALTDEQEREAFEKLFPGALANRYGADYHSPYGEMWEGWTERAALTHRSTPPSVGSSEPSASGGAVQRPVDGGRT